MAVPLILFVLFAATAALQLGVKQPRAQITLRDWLKTKECVNLALVPQYNNQHSIWGLVEFLRKDGLLSHLTGVSACSGGTLPGAFIAAGKEFSDFSKVFPKNGWNGFGPSEPKISEDYTKFLSAGLPKTFEELKVPFAISATHWDSLDALKTFTKAKSHEVVLSQGELYPAMITAVTTANSGVIPDPNCPKCSAGFWPKQHGSLYPLTDGAFTDIWGTQGLVKLPKCDRLLHVLPLDYPGQTKPQAPQDIPTYPKDVVTLVVTQPPTASHSYFADARNEMLKKSVWTKQFVQKKGKNTQAWNDLMYRAGLESLQDIVDTPMHIEKITDNSKHYSVLVDNGRILRKSEGIQEKVYDAYMDTLRDNFWKFWGSQDSTSNQQTEDKEKSSPLAVEKKKK